MTDFRGLLTEDDAVSPVIGIVLMVAVTVILSAAVGAFVLDIGNAVTEQRPNVVMEFEYEMVSGNPDSVSIRHNGGDTLETSTVRVTIDGSVVWEDGSAVGSAFTEETADWDDGVTSNDVLTLKEDTGDLTESSTVQVVWQKDGQSSIIASSKD